MKKNFISIGAIITVVLTIVFLTSGKFGDQPKKPSCTRPEPGYSSGAPAGVCGDPFNGYLTCAKSGCHSSYPVKYRSAIISFNPALQPYGYIPNYTYTVSATFASNGCPNLGFEISPQSRSGTMLGRMANLASSSNPTLINGLEVSSDSNYYITHSTPGGPNSATWQFIWKAPAKGGLRADDSVIFYQCYNAAPSDDGGGPTLDTIIAATTVIAQDTIVGAGIPDIVNSELQAKIYPTIVSNAEFTVVLESVNEKSVTTMEIYNMNGQKVYQSQISNLKSLISFNEPNGCYIVWLKTENASTCRKIMVIH